MDPTDAEVAEKFAEYAETPDPILVREALEVLEAAERDMPTQDEGTFAEVLRRRLHFFAALDRTIDPGWDATKLPVKGATPPATHGVIYPSGEVDPASIPDPDVRADYERSLKASKDYERYYDQQFQLRQVDERAMRFVERSLAERLRSSSEARHEFGRFVASSDVSDLRKDRLRALLPR